MENARRPEKWNDDPVLSKLIFQKREDLGRMINCSYIAERFFGKSASWFCQKLNRTVKNGKPCDFTAEERETLANALYTMTFEIQDLADELRER